MGARFPLTLIVKKYECYPLRDHVEGGVGVSCQCRGVTHSTRVRRDGVLVFQVYAIGFRLRRGVDDLRRTTRKRERMGCEWRGRGGFVASGLELASRVIRGSSSKRLTSTPVKCGVPAICYTNPKGIPTCGIVDTYQAGNVWKV